MRFRIFRGDRRSSGAIALNRALRAAGHRSLLNNRGQFFTSIPSDAVLINWGCSDSQVHTRMLNRPAAVAGAANKVATARLLEAAGVPAPRHTTQLEEAQQWDCRRIVVRHLVSASQGRGVEVVVRGTELPRAPLYVEYIPKMHEYRIHVAHGQVIDIQQKRKRREVPNEEVNYEIRNARHGWVFCRDSITPPPDSALEAAVDAVQAIGLDFGAVDLGYTVKEDRVAVYEVNTAPGLEGTTLERYISALVRG